MGAGVGGLPHVIKRLATELASPGHCCLCLSLTSCPFPTYTNSMLTAKITMSENAPPPPVISERPLRPTPSAGRKHRDAVLEGKRTSASTDLLRWKCCYAPDVAHSGLQHRLLKVFLVSNPYPSCCSGGLCPPGWPPRVFSRTVVVVS